MRSNKPVNNDSNKKYINFDYSNSSSSGVFFSDNSSSGNSYTPSFTMTSSSNNSYSSNNSNSNIMSSSETLQFMLEHPINPDCWRENVHAELEKFAQEKLKQAGQIVPHNSPMKKSNKSISHRPSPSVVPKVNELVFFGTPQGQELAKWNQTLNQVDRSNGRYYGGMHNEAITFKEVWEIKGLGNCEILLNACGVKSNEQLMEIINILSPIGKLMFLFIVDKYPTTTQNDQLYLLHFLQSQQNDQKADIYMGFKQMDNDLYTRFPTKDSVNNHHHTHENSDSFHFKF